MIDQTANEVLSGQVAETLEWIRQTAQSGVETTGSFIAEQTPLFIEELVLFVVAWTLVKFVFWVIALGISAFTLRKIMQSDMYKTNTECHVFTKIGMIITSVVFIVVFFFGVNPRQGALAYFAPRVFVVEKIINIVDPPKNGEASKQII